MSFASSIGSEHVQLLVLRRVEREGNMARYYVLSVEPTFLGDTAFVREWGRIGQRSRRRVDLHAALDGAQEALSVWLARKLRRGYVLRHNDCGVDGVP
jgi:predicted DNA-binding WGR domain protein